ncbi:MAG TPA: hypothetical protein VLI92_00125 [Candidatus Saccharimonadales bacterium]|nr:hypothetical protein [Candidatus Saccharimonadales bacterium]
MTSVKKILITSALSAVLLGFSSIVSAHEMASDTPSVASKCDEITTKIDKRVELFNTNKTTHEERYKTVSTRISNLITKLDDKGYDTSKLKTAFEGLTALITKFNQDYTVFIDSIVMLKHFPCGNSQGGFLEQLRVAHSDLKIVRQDTVDIRNYYKDNVRPALQELRDQKPKQTTPSQ